MGASVGLQTYVFSLPVLVLERERTIRMDPIALERARRFAPAAPANQIGHIRRLATAEDVMPYRPNSDTVYSGALLKLVDGPVILTAREILDRYKS